MVLTQVQSTKYKVLVFNGQIYFSGVDLSKKTLQQYYDSLFFYRLQQKDSYLQGLIFL